MTKGLVLSCLLALATFAGGFFLGKRNTATQTVPTTTADENASNDSPREKIPPLPRIKSSPAANPSITESGKPSLEDIEAQLRTMNVNWGWCGQGELNKMLDAIDVADIPKLLAFVEKNLPQNSRQSLRYMLISRWAEIDPQGALAYAQSIPNRQERDSAISAFAASWASKDAQAAAD